jgi:hypothetical protein
MVKVGKSVYYGNGRPSRQVLQEIVAKSPHHHRVEVAGQHPGSIPYRLTSPELYVGPIHENDMPTQLTDTYLERDTRPGGCLLENHTYATTF